MADLFIDERLRSGMTLHFCWCMLPGGHQAEVIARSNVDGLAVDMQHGVIDYNEMVEMVLGAHRGGSPAFVRLPLDDFSMVSRALDAGAAAVIMPMINTADDARRLVEAGKYPPVGGRSWGPILALNASGLQPNDYLKQANGLTKLFGMIESAEALGNLDEICAVEGLDGVFVGPNDLSISLSAGAAANAESDAVNDALPKIVAAADAAGMIAGIYASNPQQVERYAALGFRFISIVNDKSVIAQGIASAMPKQAQEI